MNVPFKTAEERIGSADQPLVSVIVNNYNYAAYLGTSIDSALQQDYAHKEVIVVDDGSTDRSRDVIAAYRASVIPVYKRNGGQASALNAGFAACRGDIVVFLDADDLLLPSAVSNIATAFLEPGLANVHWSMRVIDAQGYDTGEMRPPHPPGEGDLREQLIARGPSNLPCAPTSGNAWSRAFLQCVCPIPEDVLYYRRCADEYLYTLAPAFDRVRTIADPQSCYRIHGQNIYSSRSFREKLDLELEGYEHQCRALSATLRRHDILVDATRWKEHSWFHRLDRAVNDIMRVVPGDATLALVDGGTWDAAEAFRPRNVRPFMHRNGVEWGPPADCDSAIACWADLRRERSPYFAVAWPSFWWFDTYPRFFEQVERTADCIIKSDAIVIYRLFTIAASDAEFERLNDQTEEVCRHV
jgi:glycosyltransferase involved in cell wall biosynthesis